MYGPWNFEVTVKYNEKHVVMYLYYWTESTAVQIKMIIKMCFILVIRYK